MLRCSTSPGGMRVILEGLRNVDVRSDLPRVTVPTLVMHRRGDRAVRVDAGAHLAAQIPGAEWRPLDGDDHWWWCGDWERVAQEVVAFAGSRAA
jgi:pimeloyl-ACP methyl ester carboxylesterase